MHELGFFSPTAFLVTKSITWGTTPPCHRQEKPCALRPHSSSCPLRRATQCLQWAAAVGCSRGGVRSSCCLQVLYLPPQLRGCLSSLACLRLGL